MDVSFYYALHVSYMRGFKQVLHFCYKQVSAGGTTPPQRNGTTSPLPANDASSQKRQSTENPDVSNKKGKINSQVSNTECCV